MVHSLSTEIAINASPDKVWNALTDFESYPTWNPFIKSISGILTVGQRLVVRLEPPGASGMTFKPKVTNVEVNKRFSWLGHLLVPGLFDGEHIFELSGDGNGGTRFVQRENFNGILIPLLRKMIDNNTKQGFESMNQKLKTLAETAK